jgi:hypothetical protein
MPCQAAWSAGGRFHQQVLQHSQRHWRDNVIALQLGRLLLRLLGWVSLACSSSVAKSGAIAVHGNGCRMKQSCLEIGEVWNCSPQQSAPLYLQAEEVNVLSQKDKLELVPTWPGGQWAMWCTAGHDRIM